MDTRQAGKEWSAANGSGLESDYRSVFGVDVGIQP